MHDDKIRKWMKYSEYGANAIKTKANPTQQFPTIAFNCIQLHSVSFSFIQFHSTPPLGELILLFQFTSLQNFKSGQHDDNAAVKWKLNARQWKWRRNLHENKPIVTRPRVNWISTKFPWKQKQQSQRKTKWSKVKIKYKKKRERKKNMGQ